MTIVNLAIDVGRRLVSQGNCRVMGMTKHMLPKGVGVAAISLACWSAYAGDNTWTQDKVSSAINYSNVEVVTPYAPDASAPRIAPGSQITHVYAMRSYMGNAMVETSLCWNGTSRCVPLNGNHINTHAFDGLDASKPMYLVHKARGDKARPLPGPVFVKGSVAVWYAP